MQKVLMFTREEVVTALEIRVEEVVERFEDDVLCKLSCALLLGEVRAILSDVTLFDVFIDKGVFRALNKLNKSLEESFINTLKEVELDGKVVVQQPNVTWKSLFSGVKGPMAY